jgi:hypothetical protein
MFTNISIVVMACILTKVTSLKFPQIFEQLQFEQLLNICLKCIKVGRNCQVREWVSHLIFFRAIAPSSKNERLCEITFFRESKLKQSPFSSLFISNVILNCQFLQYESFMTKKQSQWRVGNFILNSLNWSILDL